MLDLLPSDQRPSIIRVMHRWKNIASAASPRAKAAAALALLGAALLLAGLLIVRSLRPELRALERTLAAQHAYPHASDSSVMLDRHGRPIAFWGNNLRRFQPLSQLGKIATHGLIAAEDQRFRSRLGFDPIAIAREAVHGLTRGRVGSGASTITSQLVKDLLGHRHRGLRTKAKEFVLAYLLHRRFTPRQLLTAYINRIYLGHRSIGFRAAAWQYFGRPYRTLNSKEQLSLIALIPSPSRNNPLYSEANHRAITRKLLERFARRGVFKPKVVQAIARQPLRYKTSPIHPPNIGYFRDFVAQQARQQLGLGVGAALPRGITIHTGYDSAQHRRMSEAMAATSFKALEKYVRPAGSSVQAAALWVDSATGEITTMIGGRDYRRSRYNRTTLSQRSPGSTLKPIILALAMKNGFNLSTRFQNYRYDQHPVKSQEFDSGYHNLSLLEGVTMSSNHLMLRLGETLGLKGFLREARNLGIRTPLKPEWGSIIGSSDVSMFDLATLYSTIAAAGMKPTVHAIRAITRDGEPSIALRPDSHEVLSAEVAEQVQAALRQAALTGVGARPEARSRSYAGKTGTSNGMRDNWYCGYEGRRVGVVWVGADAGQGFDKLTGGGAHYALPLWLAGLAGQVPEQDSPEAGMRTHDVAEREPEFIDLSGESSNDSIEGYFAPVLFE